MGEVRPIQLQFSFYRLYRPAELQDGLLARTAAVGRAGLLDGRFARLASKPAGNQAGQSILLNDLHSRPRNYPFRRVTDKKSAPKTRQSFRKVNPVPLR